MDYDDWLDDPYWLIEDCDDDDDEEGSGPGCDVTPLGCVFIFFVSCSCGLLLHLIT